jgi:regulator of sigma E protease
VFDFLPMFLRTPLAFIVVLGVLVFIHELGHYLAARWRGVYVEAFSIGFGPKLLSWTDNIGTVWKLCLLPLGGYVKLHGQEQPTDVSDETRAAWKPGQTFNEKPVLSRAIVVAAGPIANFVLAAVLFALMFAVSGRPLTEPVVGGLVENSAAAKAGIQVGDRVDAIDGQKIRRFEDIQAIVSVHAGQQLKLDITRDGHPITITAVPESKPGLVGKVIGVLGMKGSTVTYEPVSALEALPDGIVQTWTVAGQTLAGVGQMLSGQRGTDDLGGPLRIAQLSGQVAQLGFANLVSFIAVLSVNLGLINLFPIPVLDGGHLVFYLFEAIRGKPLPPRALEYGLRAGFALLIGLFVFATWNDLSHFGLFSWVSGLLS